MVNPKLTLNENTLLILFTMKSSLYLWFVGSNNLTLELILSPWAVVVVNMPDLEPVWWVSEETNNALGPSWEIIELVLTSVEIPAVGTGVIVEADATCIALLLEIPVIL